MIYREFKDKKLSALGFGCMRLPVVDGVDSNIDEAAAAEMVAYAMEHGVNYYDTAWGYHSGNSELVMGKVLEGYPRDSFYLASKFPGYDLSNMPKVQEIFERQLQKCRVDYFDFYLIHNVCEKNINEYLDEQYGIFDYLMQQKKNRRIRHLGFSAHGSLEVIRRFLEAYGKDMEFGQLQLNWLDYNFQQAVEKVKLLKEHNIPVWVMEPLRGGSLASFEPKYRDRIAAIRPEEDAVALAFRFLQGIDEVTVTLSGMSNLSQLKANIATYESCAPLSESEREELLRIADDMTSGKALPCTKCRYCTTYCPKGLDIPWLIELYNEHLSTDGNGFIAPMAIDALDDRKKPMACIDCRRCESVCPQGLKISEAMADFSRLLTGE